MNLRRISEGIRKSGFWMFLRTDFFWKNFWIRSLKEVLKGVGKVSFEVLKLSISKFEESLKLWSLNFSELLDFWVSGIFWILNLIWKIFEFFRFMNSSVFWIFDLIFQTSEFVDFYNSWINGDLWILIFKCLKEFFEGNFRKKSFVKIPLL